MTTGESLVRIASHYIGMKEVKGAIHNPAIVAMLRLDADWPKDDETSWCSAFTNWVCWNWGAERSRSLAARSWLQVGKSVANPETGDIVVFWRGDPGGWQGHVGFYIGHGGGKIEVLGGNQGDAVSVASYSASQFLGYRRLSEI